MFQKNTSKSNREESIGTSKERSAEKNPKKPSARTNVILSDVEITGSVKFKNDVVIDGKIDGEIFSDGSVTIGHQATVNAEIRCKSVIVEGRVKGDIHASDRLELGKEAEVTGDIKASVLSMQAGAVLVGTSSVGSVPKSDCQVRNGSPRRELAVI